MAAAVGAAVLIGSVTVPAMAVPASSSTAASKLDWQPCSDPQFQKWQKVDGAIIPSFQCAVFERPLVRGKAKGKKVELAVVRLPASGTPEQRKGVLLFNPGGPGQTGVGLSDIVYLLPEEIRESFDFISWDPRGIGASKPAIGGPGCNIGKPTRPATGRVDWQKVLDKRIPQVKRMNARCFKNNRSLINNAGTVDNAYDMEALRKALGEQQISYWGLSYGTMLGSTYIQMFPNRLRAVVLDSSMDPQMRLSGWNESSVSPDHSIGFFLEANPDLKPQYYAVIKKLNDHTLTLPDGSRYTRWDILDVLNDSVMFYADPGGDWAQATKVITTTYNALFGSGSVKQDARQALMQSSLRSPKTGSVGGVFSAVVCQDFSDRLSRSEKSSQMKWAVRNGPIYGGSLGVDYITVCNGLGKAEPHPVPTPRRFGPDVPGIILGNTRDGETPYQWTVNMGRVYRSMRTVTLVGGLHGTFGLSMSPCVDNTAADFLVTRTLPAVDQSCPWSPPL